MKKKLILLGLVLCANLNMVAQHHEKKLGDFELVELVSQKLILFGTEHGHWHVAAGFEKETTKELSLEPVLVAELGYSWFSFTQKIREGGRFFGVNVTPKIFNSILSFEFGREIETAHSHRSGHWAFGVNLLTPIHF